MTPKGPVRSRVVAAFALGAIFVGCHPPAPCERTAAVDEPFLELELGNPDGFARPTPEGTHLAPSAGAQGGHHLWLSVHSAGLWPGEARALGNDRDVPSFQARLVDESSGAVVAEQSWAWWAMDGDELDATLALQELYLTEPGDGATGEALGSPPAPQPVRLDLTAADLCGTELTAGVSVVLDW